MVSFLAWSAHHSSMVHELWFSLYLKGCSDEDPELVEADKQEVLWALKATPRSLGSLGEEAFTSSSSFSFKTPSKVTSWAITRGDSEGLWCDMPICSQEAKGQKLQCSIKRIDAEETGWPQWCPRGHCSMCAKIMNFNCYRKISPSEKPPVRLL